MMASPRTRFLLNSMVSATIFICLIYYLLNTSTLVQQATIEYQKTEENVAISAEVYEVDTYKPMEEMKQRAQAIQQACLKHPELTKYLPRSGPAYLSNRDRSILYCPVPKCGWSSWRWMIFKEWGPPNFEVILDDQSKTAWKTPWELANMSVHTLLDGNKLNNLHNKVLFVRDPYDRLVSAYKDKVLSNNMAYVKRFKSPCKWVNQNTTMISFPQFVQCIIDNIKSHSRNHMEKFNAAAREDFHWKPQSLLCNVCAVNFSIIGHFEHMQDDLRETLDILGMRKAQPAWQNAVTSKKSIGSWYKSLSKQQLKDLKSIYKYDFELFGFNEDPPI